MSGFESLMWELERDPRLSSAFANLTLFDRAPNRAIFRARMAQATIAVPRLRQRVVDATTPWGHPTWIDDPDFDLDHHLRWVDLGGSASEREVDDLAATLMRQPFDRERPLWEFVTIEGLEHGRAAMLQRLHHTITDGEGGIRLSVQFLDFEQTPEPPVPAGSSATAGSRAPAARGGSDRHDAPLDAPLDGAAPDHEPDDDVAASDRPGLLQRSTGLVTGAAARAVAEAGALPRRGSDLTAVARSTVRQVTVGPRRSPLWTERSLERWLGTSELSLDEVKRAANHLGGSVNDLFIAGAATAAGRVHAAAGHPVDELRVSMPVSTRHDRSVGGNAFSPTQTLVPTGEMDVTERFERIHEILNGVKAERAIGSLEGAANAASLLPSVALVRTGQHLASSVDFVCSNVRAAPFDLFIGGALMEANYPLGPLAGTAFNLTTMSYRGTLFLGLVTDRAAIDDPEELLAQLLDSYDELLSVGGVTRRR
ncbi:MAG: wax ester/triacylglycerol synthase domain-containing protein [Microthrixaceae bacterium]